MKNEKILNYDEFLKFVDFVNNDLIEKIDDERYDTTYKIIILILEKVLEKQDFSKLNIEYLKLAIALLTYHKIYKMIDMDINSLVLLIDKITKTSREEILENLPEKIKELLDNLEKPSMFKYYKIFDNKNLINKNPEELLIELFSSKRKKEHIEAKSKLKEIYDIDVISNSDNETYPNLSGKKQQEINEQFENNTNILVKNIIWLKEQINIINNNIDKVKIPIGTEIISNKAKSPINYGTWKLIGVIKNGCIITEIDNTEEYNKILNDKEQTSISYLWERIA